MPIIVYNENNDVIYIFDDDNIYDSNKDDTSVLDQKKFLPYKEISNMKKYIVMRYFLMGASTIPINIEVLYFK